MRRGVDGYAVMNRYLAEVGDAMRKTRGLCGMSKAARSPDRAARLMLGRVAGRIEPVIPASVDDRRQRPGTGNVDTQPTIRSIQYPAGSAKPQTIQ